MLGKFVCSLTLCAAISRPGFGAVVINEIDTDQAGTDAGEFIELKGTSNQPMSGLVLVLFNGGSVEGGTPESYRAMELSGTANAGGHFVVGNPGVPGVQITFPNGTLQNGEDAVALYTGTPGDFPPDTPPTATGLLDVAVYENGNDTDVDWSGYGGTVTVLDENETSTGTTSSLARVPDGQGAFTIAAPTPGAPNTASTTPIATPNARIIDFGWFNAANDQDPTRRTFRITNTGGGTLNVISLAAGASTDPEFIIGTPVPMLPAARTPGQSVEVTVQFSNSDIANDQDFSGSIVYTTDAPQNSSGTIPLRAGFARIVETAAAGDVLINEICYDPNPDSPDPIQDFNRDGVADSNEDEFVELFNATGAPINIQGWVLEATRINPPATSNRAVMPLGATLPAGQVAVFFRGGTPTGFAPNTAFVSLPSLANTGEILQLSDGTTLIDRVGFEDQAASPEVTDPGVTSNGGSIGRLPDGSESFVEFEWDDPARPPSPGELNSSQRTSATGVLYR